MLDRLDWVLEGCKMRVRRRGSLGYDGIGLGWPGGVVNHVLIGLD